MFKFSEITPGAWQWAFVFREQIWARGDQAYSSRGRAEAAAEVFARGVGIALKKGIR